MKEKIMNMGLIRWITSWKICKWAAGNRFLGRFCNYEMISYIICGVLTTVLNYVVYFVMPRFESNGLDILLANGVAWLVAVIFAFVVNKIFVFDSPEWNGRTFMKEFVPFIVCRLLSLGFDELFMWVTVGLLHLNEPLFKILSNVFVLIANYVASKFLIFKKPDEAAENTVTEDK